MLFPNIVSLVGCWKLKRYFVSLYERGGEQSGWRVENASAFQCRQCVSTRVPKTSPCSWARARVRLPVVTSCENQNVVCGLGASQCLFIKDQSRVVPDRNRSGWQSGRLCTQGTSSVTCPYPVGMSCSCPVGMACPCPMGMEGPWSHGDGVSLGHENR